MLSGEADELFGCGFRDRSASGGGARVGAEAVVAVDEFGGVQRLGQRTACADRDGHAGQADQL
ncbi:hypothetical protein GCM10009634_48300 [Saccharothrix xinjiangensis]